MKGKLRLSYPHVDPDGQGDGEAKVYRVEAVVGSVEFEPGRFLDREAVLQLCARPELKITIVPPPPSPLPRQPRRRGRRFDRFDT